MKTISRLIGFVLLFVCVALSIACKPATETANVTSNERIENAKANTNQLSEGDSVQPENASSKAKSQGEIPDGLYNIESVVASGKCLYIKGDSFEAKLMIWGCNSPDTVANDQKINLTAVDYNVYKLQFIHHRAHSDLCLQPAGPTSGSGAPLQQNPCGNKLEQQWMINPIGNYYRIKNQTGNLCMELNKGDVGDHDPVFQRNCADAGNPGGYPTNQLWTLKSTIDVGDPPQKDEECVGSRNANSPIAGHYPLGKTKDREQCRKWCYKDVTPKYDGCKWGGENVSEYPK